MKKALGVLVVASFLFGSMSMFQALELQAEVKAKPQVASQTQVVSVNKATLDELQTVRGIGPALAERIIKYREEHGKFERLEDIVNVRGIGEAKFQKIKNQVTI